MKQGEFLGLGAWGAPEFVVWLFILSVVRSLSESPKGSLEGKKDNDNGKGGTRMRKQNLWKRLKESTVRWADRARRKPWKKYIFETIWTYGAGVMATHHPT